MPPSGPDRRQWGFPTIPSAARDTTGAEVREKAAETTARNVALAMVSPASLQPISEVRRLASPAPLPQALATPPGGHCLYLTPRGVPLLYTIDVETLVVTAEIPLSGAAWGAYVADRVITLVASDGPEDDRVIRTYDLDGDVATDVFRCPESTGSYVAMHAGSLWLTQFYKRRLLQLDDAGTVVTETLVPHDICGVAWAGETVYLITTDDEESEAYFLTRVDGTGAAAKIEDVARIPFRARSLAWDGEKFWTNHRERHEIVAFRKP